ncbi:MAG TPA: hypothetical protein VFO89_08530 [Thermoanaerobaculia bacterium]|nr:hypothetical protein [Thermoanaerobaculia bacterium]
MPSSIPRVSPRFQRVLSGGAQQRLAIAHDHPLVRRFAASVS